jgi:K+ transporter
VTELVPGEVVRADLSADRGVSSGPVPARSGWAALVVGAVGVVYGDIGLVRCTRCRRCSRSTGVLVAVAVGVVFGGVELTFFCANLSKVVTGGWLTLMIAATVLTAMLTWRRRREPLLAR